MTKEEFKGFSSAAQHDMVLEALVRITKNLETMEKESGKPFMGTSKQRRNDIKLLTILAEAFGKNELVLEQKPRVTVDAGKYIPSDKVVVTGVGMERYNNKSMAELLDPVEGIRGIRDDMNKIVGAQQKASKFMSCVSIDDKSIYPVKSIAKTLDNSGISKGVVEGFKKVSNERMAKRRSK
ncbi:hypothetical protein [Agathobacter sp.]|uniref:hypothetical protein n=1 Tax=Agathobacter sp. TaxID=2021311 RepID=UPI003AB140FF